MIKYAFLAFISLLCGICLNSKLFVVFVVSSIFLILLFCYKKEYRSVLVIISFILLGFLLSFVRIDFLHGQISSSGIVLERKENYYIALINFERVYIYEKDHTKEVGDILNIKGYISNIDFETLESAFNFEEYLFNKGIRKQVKVSDESYIFKMLLRLSENKERFLNNFDENTKNLIDALLFNNKNSESEAILNFKELSLFILISTSGIYLNLIKRGLYNLFFLVFDEKKSKALTFISMFYYLCHVFNKISVRKFVYLESIKLVNKKKISHFDLLSILGFIMLLLNYHYAYDLGFILTFGFSFFAYYLNIVFVNKKGFIRKIIYLFFFLLIMVPFSIHMNHEISIFSLLFQLILSPITSIFFIISLISFHIIPFTFLLNPLGELLTYLSRLFSYIDVNIYFDDNSSVFIIFYYLILLIVFYFYETKNKTLLISSSLVLASFVSIKALPIKSFYENSVTFLNVGQGDACVIRNKNKVIMIDSGGSLTYDIARNSLINYFKKEQIYKIDYFFGSHSDFDHVGALSSLKELIKIDNILIGKFKSSIKVGDIVFTNLNNFSFDNDNDNSSVIKFSFLNKVFLFTGDIGSNVEYKMIANNINFDCDILKISHHGSKYSSTIEFLTLASPNDAIISVGKNNNYDHPHEEVINRLKYLNINVLRTDKIGSIKYS